MSGLLFLASLVGFVLVAYWAFKNDTMGLNEQGSGFLAMRATDGASRPKAEPKWKKASRPVAGNSLRLGGPKAASEKKPRWNQTFLPKRDL